MRAQHHRRGSQRPRVFGTGLIALDLVISIDPAQPVRCWAGGTCGNVLAILSFLGWDAYPIARLNGDSASLKVKADLQRWGVHLDYAECAPTTDTPIVVQEIRRDNKGTPKHRFSWACPQCGSWLPAFKAVTVRGIDQVTDRLPSARVFFMDRVSRASLTMAAEAARSGALVFFELSANTEGKLLGEALGISHIVKYADRRVTGGDTSDRPGPSVLLEIQTLGADGLRYRSWVPQARTRGWKHLSALPASLLADTCGAGDWCTAGIIAKIGAAGHDGLLEVDRVRLREALMYGQALAAWNCGFEGARGGMYRIEQRTFERQIRQILAGEVTDLAHAPEPDDEPFTSVSCPACPPAGLSPRSGGAARCSALSG